MRHVRREPFQPTLLCNWLGRKGPGVRAPRLDGDGLGDDGDVGNILMPLLTSMGVPPKRLGLIRNCRLLSSSR